MEQYYNHINRNELYGGIDRMTIPERIMMAMNVLKKVYLFDAFKRNVDLDLYERLGFINNGIYFSLRSEFHKDYFSNGSSFQYAFVNYEAELKAERDTLKIVYMNNNQFTLLEFFDFVNKKYPLPGYFHNKILRLII